MKYESSILYLTRKGCWYSITKVFYNMILSTDLPIAVNISCDLKIITHK